MAGENQVEISSTTFFDLPLYDVIVPLITRDLSDRDLLAMWEAFAEFPTYRETIEEIIGAKRHLTVSKDSPDKEIFSIAVKTCRQLRSIEIHFPKLRQNWSKSLVKLVANNPLISKIFIVYGTWEKFSKIFANAKISIRDLILCDVNMKGERLSAFFAQQPSLRRIALDNVKYSFSNNLFTIGRTCHELQELDMASCQSVAVDEDDVWYIVENCPKLRTFLLPETMLRLMIDQWGFLVFLPEVFSKGTFDLLLDRNITFCDPEDEVLLKLMEERNAED